MTGRIVVGIDGSAAADRALAWALDGAARRQCPVHLVSIFTLPVMAGGMAGGYVGPTVTGDELESMRDGLITGLEERTTFAHLSHPDVTVTTEVVQGAPAAVVLERAASADLVVLGTDGAGSFEALVLGSVSHSVAHRAACPVVLVPATTSAGGPQRVVVGVDGSEHSDTAVDFAAREAALARVDLVIVHAWNVHQRRHGDSTSGDEIVDTMRAEAEAVLTAARARAQEPVDAPPSVSTLLVEGNPTDVLLGVATADDLTVVGGRGRGALRSALLGSTSGSLIHHTVGALAVVQ